MTPEQQKIVDEFHKLYYPIHQFNWRGVRTVKCAQDIVVFQEIIHETKPEVIVECGVNQGGSTLFLSDMIGPQGLVVGCDICIDDWCDPRVKNVANIRLIQGSSIAPHVVDVIRQIVAGRRTMVILDSNHEAHHVLAECRLYSPLVSSGCYLIVEDTNINGRPVFPEHGPGPAEAVEQFLRENNDFETDRSRERLLMTFNPGGYLRKR